MISKPEREKEPRVVVVGKVGGAHKVKIIGPKALADRIGSDLFAAFLKCFIGCDRISTFEQMFFFNGKYLPESSVAYERNLRVTFLILASTMHELGAALQQLCRAKVIEKMADKSIWKPMNEFRKRWNPHPTGSKLRNQAGHHLGDRDLYRKGTAELLTRPELLLLRADDETRLRGEFSAAWEAQFFGLNIDEKTFEATIAETQDAHLNFSSRLMDVFREVVITANVEFSDERTKRRGLRRASARRRPKVGP